jgi:hypothetical protein
MGKKLGTNFVIGRNTGSHGSPVWPVAACCRDIKLDIQQKMFDSSDRSSTGDSDIPTRYAAKLEADALWDGGDFLTAVRTAFLAGSPIDLIAIDGVTAGKGLWAEWAVTEFPIDAPLAAGQPIKLGFQPHGNAANQPQFVTGKAMTGTEAVSTKKLGTNAVLHDGTNPITAARDMKFSIAPGALFDSSDRVPSPASATVFFDSVIPTRFKYGIEASFLWNPGDAQVLAFWSAFITGAPVTMYALDGAKGVSGSWGLYGDWAISGFPNVSTLADGQKVDLKFSPHGNGSNAVTVYTDPGP